MARNIHHNVIFIVIGIVIRRNNDNDDEHIVYIDKDHGSSASSFARNASPWNATAPHAILILTERKIAI